jgi:hypothetical protein
VHSLQLGSNFITDAGVRAITLHVFDSPALRSLNLNGNPLKSQAGREVALMLMEPKCKVCGRCSGGACLESHRDVTAPTH